MVFYCFKRFFITFILLRIFTEMMRLGVVGYACDSCISKVETGIVVFSSHSRLSDEFYVSNTTAKHMSGRFHKCSIKGKCYSVK